MLQSSIVIGLTVVAAATAQSSSEPLPRPLLPETIPVHQAADDMGAAYGIWAAGRDYKVSFHDGMTFLPYLGGAYPRNQPWSWATESVSIGDRELTRTDPTGHAERLRYRYDFGAFEEIYEVRPEGLHQSFMIRERPEGPVGPLVVRGRVTTMLQAKSRAPRHGELRFVDSGGVALLSYGAAFAIDADGRRTPMTTSWSDDEIELAVDGEWLEQARFPVVVDPLLSNATVYISGSFLAATDVFREENGTSIGGQNYFAVTFQPSAQDDDVLLLQTNDDFTAPVNVLFFDVTAAWSASRPRIAGNGAHGKLVMAFSRWFPLTSSSAIRWTVRDYSSAAQNNSVSGIQPPPSVFKLDDWRVDVGGTRGGSTGDSVLLVWQRETSTAGSAFQNQPRSDVHAALLDVSAPGMGLLGNQFAVRVGSSDSEGPEVNTSSEGGRGAYPWVVALSENDNALGSWWQLWLGELRSDGTASRGTFVDAGQSFHKLGPVIEGTSGRYLVGYTISTAAGKSQTGYGTRLGAARVDLGAAGLSMQPSRTVAGWTAPRLRARACSFDTDTMSHWLLGSENAQNSDFELRLLGYSGQVLREETLSGGDAGPSSGFGLCFNPDLDEHVCAHTRRFIGWVWGNRFQYPSVVPWSLGGSGCSTASIRWFCRTSNTAASNQLIGNEFSGVRVSSAPAGAIHFLALSTARVDLPVPVPLVGPGCRLLVDNSARSLIGVLDFRIGDSASWVLPIPESLLSAAFHFQDWILDPATGLFESTRRLQVPVVK